MKGWRFSREPCRPCRRCASLRASRRAWCSSTLYSKSRRYRPYWRRTWPIWRAGRGVDAGTGVTGPRRDGVGGLGLPVDGAAVVLYVQCRGRGRGAGDAGREVAPRAGTRPHRLDVVGGGSDWMPYAHIGTILDSGYVLERRPDVRRCCWTRARPGRPLLRSVRRCSLPRTCPGTTGTSHLWRGT